MAVANSVPHVNEIKVGVNLDNMDRTVGSAILFKGVYTGNVDGMVATKNNWLRPRFQDLSHAILNIGVAPFSVGVDNISVAKIYNSHLS